MYIVNSLTIILIGHPINIILTKNYHLLYCLQFKNIQGG